jgi:hypothetical protein
MGSSGENGAMSLLGTVRRRKDGQGIPQGEEERK